MSIATVISIVFLLAVSSAQVLHDGCYNGEFFESQPCGIPTSSIEILNGLATVQASRGSLVTIGTSESCDWNLGSCSTSMISGLTSGVGCTSQDCVVSVDFNSIIDSIAIGAIVQHSSASRGIEISGYSSGRLVFRQIIDQSEHECTSPSSFIYSYASGFDRIEVRGNQIVISELSVCTADVPSVILYSGGETCSDVQVGECIACQDIFGTTNWNRISCSASGECATIRFSGDDCTGVGIRVPIPTMDCDRVSAAFNVPEGAMCFFAQLPVSM
jgi:hypothetical protein